MSALVNPDVGEGIDPLSPAVARRLRVAMATSVGLTGIFVIAVTVANRSRRNISRPTFDMLDTIVFGLGIVLLAGGMCLSWRAVRHQQRRRQQLRSMP